MATLNVSLPDPMREFIQEQISRQGYSTASEYIRQLVRADQKQIAEARLETLLIEGLESGQAVEISDEWWQEKKAALRARLQGRLGE